MTFDKLYRLFESISLDFVVFKFWSTYRFMGSCKDSVERSRVRFTQYRVWSSVPFYVCVDLWNHHCAQYTEPVLHHKSDTLWKENPPSPLSSLPPGNYRSFHLHNFMSKMLSKWNDALMTFWDCFFFSLSVMCSRSIQTVACIPFYCWCLDGPHIRGTCWLFPVGSYYK